MGRSNPLWPKKFRIPQLLKLFTFLPTPKQGRKLGYKIAGKAAKSFDLNALQCAISESQKQGKKVSKNTLQSDFINAQETSLANAQVISCMLPFHIKIKATKK